MSKADPSRRQGMSTVVSVKGAKPTTTNDKSSKNSTAGKRKAVEASGKDGKNKKPKKKA
jgi:hypothetical protein